jgi:hypothetical protein
MGTGFCLFLALKIGRGTGNDRHKNGNAGLGTRMMGMGKTHIFLWENH